ncbi:MAG: hypothetical protein ABIZ56_12720 [Chthoniobacteraceae bacterium]
MNAKALAVVLTPVIAAGGYLLWPQSGQPALQSPSMAQAAIVALAAVSALDSHNSNAPAPVASGPAEPVDLQAAIEQGRIKAEFSGNGREAMRATLSNTGSTTLQARVEVGLVFESGRNAVVAARPTEVEIEPGKTVQATFQTAATRSGNSVGNAPYVITYNHVPRVELLLTYAQDHLELSPGAIQTAILALNENLPLSSVAKFTSGTSELESRFNTDAFRVETYDIITALAALREMGVADSTVAMTLDPQLRIEAMIEPLSRPAAMRYYRIPGADEWTYWKTELLAGEPATRHYALYGIARFYPDVAMEMLPKWALETKTNSVFRLSALQALAETQRPEAVNVLNRLAENLGRETELGRAARGAAMALDQRLSQLAIVKNAAVAFRTSQNLTQF